MQVSAGDHVLYYNNYNDELRLGRIVPGTTKTQLRMITIAQADATGLSMPEDYNDDDTTVKSDTSEWGPINLVLFVSSERYDAAEYFRAAKDKLFPAAGEMPAKYKNVTADTYNEKLEPNEDEGEEMDFDQRLDVLLKLR